jgi:hypothetical protein
MKMKKILRLTGIAVLAILVSGFIISCQDNDKDDLGLDSKGKATVVFKITDAPFPASQVEEAYVTVDWIKLLKAGMEEEFNEEETESEEASFVLVELEEPATFNLLELRNGLTAVMAEMELPAGSYTEIRLHVLNAGIILKDGTSFPLKIPSGDASGLKLKMTPELTLEDGDYAEVLCDFDVSRSFVMQGNINNIQGFIFKPVVRVVAHVETEAGEISGTVTGADDSPVENASLTLLKGEEEVTTALTSEEGFYAIIGILPGEYTLKLVVGEIIKTVEVTVKAGKVTIKDFEL